MHTGNYWRGVPHEINLPSGTLCLRVTLVWVCCISIKSDAVNVCRIMVASNAGPRQFGLLHPVKNSSGRDTALLCAPAFDPSTFGPLVVTGRWAGVTSQAAWFVTEPCLQSNPGSGWWVDRYRQKRRLLEGQGDFSYCLCLLCLQRSVILCTQTTQEAQAISTSSQAGIADQILLRGTSGPAEG